MLLIVGVVVPGLFGSIDDCRCGFSRMPVPLSFAVVEFPGEESGKIAFRSDAEIEAGSFPWLS